MDERLIFKLKIILIYIREPTFSKPKISLHFLKKYEIIYKLLHLEKLALPQLTKL